MNLDALPPSHRLVHVAAAAVEVKPHKVTSSSRAAELVRARWAVMRALHDRGWTLPRIGRLLGGRNHTTVMHGLAAARDLYASDPDFAWLCDRVAAA